MTYQILHGNNLDILPTLADNSIDSIVTDPPYELGFMGKKWDSSGIAYSVELWQQCLRVLKPGGHLLSFGGTRTYHRVAVAIEDAGFELRDSIAWLYGSGFPKSFDVSKAIDKSDATALRRERDLEFVHWMRTTGLKQQQINNIIGKSDVGSHYLRLDQPAVATAELFDKLRLYLPEVPENIEKLVAERTVESENFKNREVLGVGAATCSQLEATGVCDGHFDNGTLQVKHQLATAPSTPEAQTWQGWGTALKPAFEPVIVARKPIEATVANNVLKWGTGGLNIDGSRIGSDGGGTQCSQRDKEGNCTGHQEANNSLGGGVMRHGSNTVSGRWPANIILDPYTAELLDEQSGTSKSPTGTITQGGKAGGGFDIGSSNGTRNTKFQGHGDSGGASRFFYVAKASKRDRNEGLEGLPEKIKPYGNREIDDVPEDGDRPGSVNDKFTTQPAKNFHPTVKPTSLMEYLIKLVTPPNGTVLDPFTGSGSTGKAAILQGFDFIGIEMTEEYLPIIEGRLKHAEHIVAERIKEASLLEQEKLF
jgi:DNA modification methylase